MFNKKEEDKYDIDYVKQLYKTHNGRFNITTRRRGANVNMLADSTLFEGNVIILSNMQTKNIKNKKNLNINLQMFIRQNINIEDKINEEGILYILTKKFSDIIKEFIKSSNENDYAIILSSESNSFDENVNIIQLNIFLLKKFEEFMIDEINNSKRKFMINQNIEEDNPFVMLKEDKLVLFTETNNSFLNINVDYLNFSEKLYKLFISKRYIPVILSFHKEENPTFCSIESETRYKFFLFVQKLYTVFYNKIFEDESEWYARDGKIYFFEIDKVVEFNRNPIMKLSYINK